MQNRTEYCCYLYKISIHKKNQLQLPINQQFLHTNHRYQPRHHFSGLFVVSLFSLLLLFSILKKEIFSFTWNAYSPLQMYQLSEKYEWDSVRSGWRYYCFINLYDFQLDEQLEELEKNKVICNHNAFTSSELSIFDQITDKFLAEMNEPN